jgi:hypothetical protein
MEYRCELPHLASKTHLDHLLTMVVEKRAGLIWMLVLLSQCGLSFERLGALQGSTLE